MRLQCSRAGFDFRVNGQPRRVLSGLEFDCGRGEFLSVLGVSGCGKSTLLRLMAGMLQPTDGEIRRTVEKGDGAGGVLLVRQDHGLFPWMTALENAAFGLEMQGRPRAGREAIAREALRGYGLAGFEEAYPGQLSSGMKQRVSVIRAFLSEPAMLLMDEPFGALDPLTRLALQQELAAACEAKPGLGVVFVTHDVDEAILLSDRVLLLGGTPGTITGEWQVPLPRPRRAEAMLEREFLELKRELLGALGVPLRRTAHA